jgi:ribosome-binding factor A
MPRLVRNCALGAGHPVVSAINFGHGMMDHLTSRRVMTTIGIFEMPRHHTKGSAPGGSQRQLRVGETVRHAVADILSQGSVHDPDLEGHIITVPEVRMSPDLKLATIYVMPLGGRDTDTVIAALARNKKFLRGEIAHRVNLKFAPDLRFRVDERFDEAERIEKLLRTPAVQRDLAPDSDDK